MASPLMIVCKTCMLLTPIEINCGCPPAGRFIIQANPQALYVSTVVPIEPPRQTDNSVRPNVGQTAAAPATVPTPAVQINQQLNFNFGSSCTSQREHYAFHGFPDVSAGGAAPFIAEHRVKSDAEATHSPLPADDTAPGDVPRVSLPEAKCDCKSSKKMLYFEIGFGRSKKEQPQQPESNDNSRKPKIERYFRRRR